MLIAVWHMRIHDVEYTDLGGQYFLERTGRARQTRRLVSQLNQLGYAHHPIINSKIHRSGRPRRRATGGEPLPVTGTGRPPGGSVPRSGMARAAGRGDGDGWERVATGEM